MNMAHILVFSNDGIASPLVCDLLAPRIYLPTRMDFRNTGLLRHILAHETMHIKRRDNWLKAVKLTVLCLNWFNPLFWLMDSVSIIVPPITFTSLSSFLFPFVIWVMIVFTNLAIKKEYTQTAAFPQYTLS